MEEVRGREGADHVCSEFDVGRGKRKRRIKVSFKVRATALGRMSWLGRGTFKTSESRESRP